MEMDRHMSCRVRLDIYLVGYGREKKGDKGKRGQIRERQREGERKTQRETEREGRGEVERRERGCLFRRKLERKDSQAGSNGKSACLNRWGMEWVELVS